VPKFIKLSIVCSLILLLGACGDELDDNNGGIVNPDPDAGDTAGEDTDPGADADTDAGFDADTETDGDGGGGGDDVDGASCSRPTSLGSLAAGQEHSFNHTLVEPMSSLATTCDLGSGGTGVHVFAVEVDVTSRVEFWTTASPSVLDLRTGGCDTPDDVLTCTDGGSYTATLSPGETYHLAVWGDINAADFELRATVQEALCSVDEPDWCEAGELNECVQNVSIRSFSCVDSCLDESSCSADACASAVTVDLSSGSTVTHTGDTGAYTSTWSADQMPQCGFSDGSAGPDTQFAETFFEVTGLTAGQELTVESTSSGDYAFFVLQDCSANECVEAVDGDDSGNQRMVWTVPQDGSYIVVVESLAAGDRSFDFEFSAQ
jgi:hypothetical protein